MKQGFLLSLCKEYKWQAQGHAATTQWHQDLNPVNMAPGPSFLAIHLHWLWNERGWIEWLQNSLAMYSLGKGTWNVIR